MPQTDPLLYRYAGSPLRGHTVILRDAKANKGRKLTSPYRVVSTTRISEVVPCLREIEALVLGQGRIAAGFVAYEAASPLGIDDVLLSNQHDKLTETTTANSLWPLGRCPAEASPENR